jgi:hypothetical protein
MGREGAMSGRRAGRARVVVGDGASMTAAIMALAGSSAPLAVLTTAALRHLVHELGSHERAVRFLVWTAERTAKPIGVNVENGDGRSRTVFLAPRTWSRERLRGWIAGHHELLGAEFGEIERIGGTP